MQVTFRQRLPIAKNIYTFQYQPSEPVSYLSGQFIKLTLPHDNPDDRGISRWFTLSSSPTEDHLANTTKFSQPGSTFKQTLFNLRPGTEVEMASPSGEFTLPEDPDQKVVFVAGGIGVTPYRSIFKWLKDKGQTRLIQLLYAANNQDELAFRELFDSFGPPVQVIYMVKEADPDWRGPTGTLSADKIKELTGDFGQKLIYLSGPRPMAEALKDQLKASGLPDAQIKTDYFPGYTQI